MDVQRAAQITLGRTAFPPEAKAQRNEKGEGANHCIFLLTEVAEGRVTDEKAHRWLGWAQCMIVQAGRGSLNDMKAINFECSRSGEDGSS